MPVAYAARGPGDTVVIGLAWPEFLRYMQWAWKPGQHIALIGPTGEGKSTFAGGLLGIRRWVVALDPKGQDDTLSATGYERLSVIPDRTLGPLRALWWRLRHWDDARQWDRIENRIAQGLPARVIVGNATRTREQDAANRKLMDDAVAYVREAGGWTLYIDEYEVATSQQMYNLAPQLNRMHNTARSAGVSVVASFQALAWVPRHATRQARFCAIWPTGDRKMIDNVAESMGRDRKELAAAVDELPPFHALVIPRGKNGGPFVCTSAPQL